MLANKYTPHYITDLFFDGFEGERLTLSCPSVLDIYDHSNKELAIRFINAINKTVAKDRYKILIKFDELTHITAAASVMLFSEISILQLYTEVDDIIIFTMPKDRACRKVFSEYHLFRAIKPGGIRKLNKLLDDNCFYQSGTEAAKHAISAILAIKNCGISFTSPEIKLFQSSILEAMLNVKHHSYPDVSDSGLRRWWQFAYYDKTRKTLFFIVYSRGLTIAESIRPICAEQNLNEGELIAKAMTKGVTSTNDVNRGKGSEEIKRTTLNTNESTLLICSGKGLYFIDNKMHKTRITEEGSRIDGTLIEWQIPCK